MKIYLAICAVLFSFSCFANQDLVNVDKQKQQVAITSSTVTAGNDVANSDEILSISDPLFIEKLHAKEQKEREEEAKQQLLQQEETKRQLLHEQELKADFEKHAHEEEVNAIISGVFITITFGGFVLLCIIFGLSAQNNQRLSNKYDPNDPNNSNRTSTSSSHDYDDDSSRWHHDTPGGINPASGLPLRTSSLDMAGNVLGSSIFSSSPSSNSHSSSSSYDPSRGY